MPSSGNWNIIAMYGRQILVGCFITAQIYSIYQSEVTFLQATDWAGASTVITLLRQGGVLIPSMIIFKNHYNSLGVLKGLFPEYCQFR